MSLTCNLRHLETKNLHLRGELPPGELELETGDEMVQLGGPLRYDLELQKLDHAILVQGVLELELDCQCVRCLKPFRHQLRIDPWAVHLPLEGEDKALVINDCVDLTPHLREDIFLAFPQHPLCSPDCRGLARPLKKEGAGPTAAGEPDPAKSPWNALDKLKL